MKKMMKRKMMKKKIEKISAQEAIYLKMKRKR